MPGRLGATLVWLIQIFYMLWIKLVQKTDEERVVWELLLDIQWLHGIQSIVE